MVIRIIGKVDEMKKKLSNFVKTFSSPIMILFCVSEINSAGKLLIVDMLRVEIPIIYFLLAIG